MAKETKDEVVTEAPVEVAPVEETTETATEETTEAPVEESTDAPTARRDGTGALIM